MTVVTPPIIPPPLARFPIGNTLPNSTEVHPTIQFQQFIQQLWDSIGGSASTSLYPLIVTLQGQVAVIFGMHGDGTLSTAGVLTVTKTNGTAFGYFATGTDASHLTGTLNPARIAANSIPYADLVNAAGAELLGASAAGAVGAMAAGRNISFAGSAVTAQDPITIVGSLGTPTAGLRAFVTDSTVAAATNFGAIVAGTGGNFVPVYADGSNWRIG